MKGLWLEFNHNIAQQKDCSEFLRAKATDAFAAVRNACSLIFCSFILFLVAIRGTKEVKMEARSLD